MLTTSTYESDVTTLPRALDQQKLQVTMCRCATDEVRCEAASTKLNKCQLLAVDKWLPFRGLGAPVCCVSVSAIVRGTSPRQAMIVYSRSSEVRRDEKNVPA